MTRRIAAVIVGALAGSASSRAVAAPAGDERAYGGVTEVAPTAPADEHDDDQDPPSREEFEAMRRRLEALERRSAPVPVPPPTTPRRPPITTGPETGIPAVGFGPPLTPADYGLRLSGYVQTQYLHNQRSEDQYQQGGRPLNRDGFAVRRGRLRVAGDWRYVAFAFELDGSTTRGPFVGVRQAHVSALWRNPDATRPPYVMVTAGLTEVPFGHELRVAQRDMMFMERSTGSLALFPGPVDVGLRVRGGIGPFRYDVAVMNGSPINDVAGSAGFDPTRKPDVAGRVGFEARPRRLEISGGVSFLTGTGLHQGQDATKNQLEWIDLNENGSIETAEIFSVPGTAALPSVRFGRWAVNADLEIGVRSRLGWSRLSGEITLAQNLDRGLFVADPFAAGTDLRHLQAYGAFLQDATRWAVFGLRYDLYDYDSDLLVSSRGRAVPADASIHTISPLVGAVLPADVVAGIRGRLMLQYDVVLDALGRDRRGVPANVKNDQITVRAQVEF